MIIIGVSQMFNFQTGQMENQIEVSTPSGHRFSVPTTAEGAERLVKMITNGHGELRGEKPPEVRRPQAAPRPREKEDVYPDGAEVFGGATIDPSEDWDDGGDEDLGSGHTKMFEKVAPKVAAEAEERAQKVQAMLGRGRNAPDRSGVPSYGITRVDARGNPMLPEPPDFGGDDEEDPGEVGSI